MCSQFVNLCGLLRFATDEPVKGCLIFSPERAKSTAQGSALCIVAIGDFKPYKGVILLINHNFNDFALSGLIMIGPISCHRALPYANDNCPYRAFKATDEPPCDRFILLFI